MAHIWNSTDLRKPLDSLIQCCASAHFRLPSCCPQFDCHCRIVSEIWGQSICTADLGSQYLNYGPGVFVFEMQTWGLTIWPQALDNPEVSIDGFPNYPHSFLYIWCVILYFYLLQPLGGRFWRPMIAAGSKL